MTGDIEKLCINLIHADTEKQVIALLKKAGYWDDPNNWHWMGGEKHNYSTIGNQQSRAEQAIIEKLINSIDTRIISAVRAKGIDPKSSEAPQSIMDARDLFFEEELKDLENLSRGITVAATGAKPREGNGRPCYTIVDNGEGQTPLSMPKTILSLNAGNKDSIKFVQGKFNMGGTGVLEFCGMENNLQLVVSKRNPVLLSNPLDSPSDSDWSFTVVRREDPSEGRSSRYSYLAPLGADQKPREGRLLHFPANKLPIFPDKNKPYVRDSAWGTLIKLYEYDAKRFGTSMMLADGLMYRTRLLLPEPALPIRFHECREYKGHSGSFDTTMVGLVETLNKDMEGKQNVEWFDKVDFNVTGETFCARIYLFKDKKASESYRKDEGIVFSYNGQCHATLTKDFFRRKRVKHDYLWHSLLVLVDCSKISSRAHEKLFMNSRDRLKDGDLRRDVESELEDLLGRHEALREMASERRKRELSQNKDTSESMAKVLENLLKSNQALANILGQGLRIKNPHKPDEAGSGVAGFIGKRFPTKFHFKGQEAGFVLVRDAHKESHARIAFETDAADDYFKRDTENGEFTLNIIKDGESVPASNYQSPRLHHGIANVSLSLPEDYEVGSQITFEALVTDPSRVEPFRNEFTLKVKPKRDETTGGEGGKKDSNSDSEDGEDKSSKGEGKNNSQDGYLDIPNPTPVFEKDWKNHEPNFDKFTAMRIKTSPEAKEGEDRYDYYINMDNIHLQTFMKQKPKEAATMKLRFSIGMTLVTLSLLHQEQMRRKGGDYADFPDDSVDVRDRVQQVTSAIAPFLLPMIESVGELEGEEEDYSESAGEAA